MKYLFFLFPIFLQAQCLIPTYSYKLVCADEVRYADSIQAGSRLYISSKNAFVTSPRSVFSLVNGYGQHFIKVTNSANSQKIAINRAWINRIDSTSSNKALIYIKDISVTFTTTESYTAVKDSAIACFVRAVASGIATLSDGDYGDVVVSGGGLVMTVDKPDLGIHNLADGDFSVAADSTALSLTNTRQISLQTKNIGGWISRYLQNNISLTLRANNSTKTSRIFVDTTGANFQFVNGANNASLRIGDSVAVRFNSSGSVGNVLTVTSVDVDGRLVINPKAGGSGSANCEQTLTKTSHGFRKFTPIYWNGSAWARPTFDSIIPTYIVIDSTSANTFKVANCGNYATTLSSGMYWFTGTSPGYTTTAPTIKTPLFEVAQGRLILQPLTGFNLASSGGGGITALTGDVTASGTGSVAATIAANAVDSTKAANLSPNDLAQTGASSGQVLTWTGSKYAPRDASGGSGSSAPPISTNVIEAIGSPSNRSDMPSCVRINGDTLLLMYEQFPAGSGDFDNYYLVKRYSYDNGVTWQARQNVFATIPLPEIDKGFGIPSLLQSNDTTHLVFWGGRNYPGDPGGNYYDAKIYYTRSTNKGVTWSTPVKIQGNSDTTYNSPGADKLTRLASGRLLYTTGVLQNSDPSSSLGNYSLYRAYSDNNGVTWTYGSMGVTAPSSFAAESGVFQLRNGRVICTFRTREKWIYASESSDNGATWGTPYPVLPSGNTMHAMKYVPGLDAVIAVYNLASFDASGVWDAAAASERANMAMSMSRDLKSWSDPVNISNYATTSIVRIEPSFFYDGSKLQVFFSPSDNGVVNYGLSQAVIQSPQLIGTELQKRTDYLFTQSIGAGVALSNAVKPTARVDVTRDNSAGGGNDIDIRVRNLGGDEIRLWDNTSSATTGNEIYLYAKQSGASNRLRLTNNNVSSTVPALNIVPDKADGASALSSADLIMQITDGSATPRLRLFGNGDVIISGNMTEGFVRKTLEVSPTTTSERLSVTGANNSASGGYARFGIGTSISGTYWPYFQSQPVGNYSSLWEWRQTTSSTSTAPLQFDFVKGAGGTLDANTVMQRWTSNGTTRMTIDQEGDLVANSFVGLLRSVAGTTTLATDVRISGSLLTTPLAGAFGEYDGTEFYATTSTASRTIFARVLKGSATLDFASTAAGAVTNLTITVTGAADGDVVSLSVPNASQTTTGSFSAWVSATNTVTIRYRIAALVGAEDPASGTFKVTVTK